jgi:hypothetical protein
VDCLARDADSAGELRLTAVVSDRFRYFHDGSEPREKKLVNGY